MKERRIGPDKIVNAISTISIVIWIIFASVFVLFAVANPTHSGMAASRPVFTGRTIWLNRIIHIFLVIQVLLGGIGLFFNLTRLKRKTDRIRLTLVLSVVLGILWLVIISLK